MRQGGEHDMETITHAPSGAAFDFLRRNDREPKPRTHGITEIRGPYYTPFGKRALQDILETMGPWVDTLKFAGGSFTLMPDRALEELIALCHEHGVLVSTGGFIERVLTQGSQAVAQYIDTCRAVGFDIIELSSGFITIPADGTHDVAWAIKLARRFLDAGAYQIMIESEGITENVRTWRTDVPARFIDALGLERIMFEAADPEVFAWYVKHYGPEVNLFVDHSQIVQLESLRQGIWGTASLWGRVVTYKGEQNAKR
jgi:phosphosulfolactate synthase (CoM biosynthesis protein A)